MMEPLSLREVTSKELEEKLKAHKLWLVTGGKEGQRADLQNIDLRKHDNLFAVLLEKADLRGANLSGLNLTHALLREADLSGAIARGTDFPIDHGYIEKTILRNADLRGANLTETKPLETKQLAGANLTNAKLPEATAQFDVLTQVEHLSKDSRKLHISMVLTCLYSLLTILATTDVSLLTDSVPSPLPVFGSEIPIPKFYLTAPFILLALYCYLHLNLQNLWGRLAELPAFFPDGTTLHQKAYPWVLNGLVCAHLDLLKKERPALSRLQNFVSLIVTWCAVPLTLFYFWGRYLTRHGWTGTYIHIVILTVSIWAAIVFYRLCVITLRYQPRQSFKRRMLGHCLILICTGLSFYYVSIGAIEGVREYSVVHYHLSPLKPDQPVVFSVAIRVDPEYHGIRGWIPTVFRSISFADFDETDVSIKPNNWKGLDEEIPLVKGARLKGSNLRYAMASRAFLVNADLRGADLQKATLRGADLRNASLHEGEVRVGSRFKFIPADLHNANLTEAKLQGADLTKADLHEAVLYDANLQKAKLIRADLRRSVLVLANMQNAILDDANLEGAVLIRANLSGTSLAKANLKGAILSDETGAETPKGLTQKQIDSAITDDTTILPKSFRKLR